MPVALQWEFMRTLINRLMWCFCMLPVFDLGAQAVRTAHAEAELIAEAAWLTPGQPFWVGLRLKLEKGWHTYWRNPGDAGLPIAITWDLPEGFTAGEIQWPYPERIADPPLVSYGYHGETLLLVQVMPPATSPGTAIELQAKASWLVCREECLPESARLRLTLPVKESLPAAATKWAPLFAQTRTKLPLPSSAWQVAAYLRETSLVLALTPPPAFKQQLHALIFCPAEEMIIENAVAPRFTAAAGRYQLEFQISTLRQKPLTRIAGVLISDKGWRGHNTEKALWVDLPVQEKGVSP